MTRKLAQSTKRAFTLIEISIVLVIVGLLAGVILLSAEMIRAAEIRAEINRLTSYRVALRSFELKYEGLPGDFDLPGVIADVPDAHLGNGNGYLENLALGVEWITAWEHLSKAGLISGYFDGQFVIDGPRGQCKPDRSCPTTAFNRTTVYMLANVDFNGALYGSPYSTDPEAIAVITWNGYDTTSETGYLRVAETFALDSKLDDGQPDTGLVLTINSSRAADGCVDGTPVVTDGTVRYRVESTAEECQLIYVVR